jgi:hypothetical protein
VPTPQQPTIRSLIDIQRRLAGSGNPIGRIGALIAAGVLGRRLAALTDPQIGQLMIDEVDPDLGIAQPEQTICRQATQRLFRSPGGMLTEEDLQKQSQRTQCPLCGNDMLLHYGIDEPDFLECVRLDCGHREYLTGSKGEERD